MMALPALFAILGYALLLYRLVKWPIETTFLFISCSIIIVLYYGGLIGGLLITAQLLLLLGLVFFVIALFLLLHEQNLPIIFTPGGTFFLIGVLVLWFITNSNAYSYFLFGDDFSHWARATKVICFKQAFISMDDPVWFKDYPPGTALFHYFFCQLGGFTENTSMFAHGILLLAAPAQLLVVVKKERWHIVGLFLFFCYVLLYTFDTGFHTLGVDLILGAFFGVTIAGYWLSDRSIASILRLAPVVIALPLIKSAGIFCSLVIIAIAITDQVWILKHKKSGVISLLGAVLLVPVVVLTQISWTQHVNKMGASQTLKTNVAMGKIIDSFTPSLSTERQKNTIHNFVDQITPFSFERMKFNVFFWHCLFLLGVCYRVRRWEHEPIIRGSLNVHFLWMWGGMCAYLFGLLIMYMFSFGDYEGVRLASFWRYVKIYLIGVITVLFSMLLELQVRKEKAITESWNFLLPFSILCFVLAWFSRLPAFGIALICMLLIVYFLKRNHSEKLKNFLLMFPILCVLTHVVYSSSGNQTSEYKDLVSYNRLIQQRVPANKNVYFIWQQSTGRQLQMFSYGIIPRFSNQGCWSIGEPYYQGDVWTCKMDVEAFRAALADYDYLFVAHADDRFWNQYSSLTGRGNAGKGRLFLISKARNTLTLSRIN